jgi:hypothetical protein
VFLGPPPPPGSKGLIPILLLSLRLFGGPSPARQLPSTLPYPDIKFAKPKVLVLSVSIQLASASLAQAAARSCCIAPSSHPCTNWFFHCLVFALEARCLVNTHGGGFERLRRWRAWRRRLGRGGL